MQLDLKTHISPLLATGSLVAQWLGHPTRSPWVEGSSPIWGSEFSEFPAGSINISFHFIRVYHSHIHSILIQNTILRFGVRKFSQRFCP